MKTHLLDSNEPLVAGLDYMAICGRRISKAHFSFCFDVSAQGYIAPPASASTLLFCRECFRPAPTPKRYLYGMIDGELAKHAEAFG